MFLCKYTPTYRKSNNNNNNNRLFVQFLLSQLTHDAVGHEVMPVEFAAAVIPLVEVFHLGDQVLQLGGQRDKNLLAAP